MRRLLAALGACAVVLAGCADEGAEPVPTGDDRETFVAARDRYVAACERIGGSVVPEGCGQLVDRAIEDALGAECTVGSLDAYIEVGIARGFVAMPAAAFFDACPGSLASAALPDAPDGYTEVDSPARGVGLLDTDAVATTFVDASAMADYLGEIGHQVSYVRRWHRETDATVTVRLDRFDTIEGASHFTARELDDGDDGAVVVMGVDDGRITRQEFDAVDERERLQQVAFGRVCDVAVSVVVQAGDQAWDDEVLEELFVRQVHRVRAVTSC